MPNKDPQSLNCRVAPGALLPPEELRAQFIGLTRTPTLDGYGLFTTLPDRVVRLLESTELPKSSELGIALMPRGLIVAVLAVQAGALQVRYLVTLDAEHARDWLVNARQRKQPLLCALDILETNQFALVGVRNLLNEGTSGQWPKLQSLLAAPRTPLDAQARGQRTGENWCGRSATTLKICCRSSRSTVSGWSS